MVTALWRGEFILRSAKGLPGNTLATQAPTYRMNRFSPSASILSQLPFQLAKADEAVRSCLNGKARRLRSFLRVPGEGCFGNPGRRTNPASGWPFLLLYYSWRGAYAI